MNLHYTYLLVDVGCLLFPLLFSFTARFPFHKEFRKVYMPMLLTAVLFLLWDVAFTHLGVWSFNPDYTLGINVFNLPVEEILFFLCIPYACVFTYYCMKPLQSLNGIKAGTILSVLLITFCAVMCVLYYDKLYTLTTCLSLLVALSWLVLRKVDFLLRMLVAYFAVIPFFILSNGILTGMLTEAPVVIYNDQENCGVRLLTIPVEDIFYGMLLVVLNVAGYEWVNKRQV